MKKTITTLIIAIFAITGLNAQEVKEQLGEAQSAYKTGDLQGSRFALQQAINEVDRAIGAEILKILPKTMGNMNMVEEEDNITATSLGYVGLFVSRSYKTDETLYASLEIISDSPLLSGVSAILALPVFGSDPNQKRIRVNGKRALLQKNQDDSGTITWDVQIPVGSTLLSFHCSGIENEKDVIEMANTIPVEQIARFAQ